MPPVVTGTLGAAILLVAFVLDETGVWKSDDLSYDIANLLGAALLAWYAFELRAWPFFALDAVWALVALRDVFRDVRPDRRRRRL